LFFFFLLLLQEQALRLSKKRVFRENQEFWEHNNQHFSDMKTKFIQGFNPFHPPSPPLPAYPNALPSHSLDCTLENGTNGDISPEKLSVFYKQYLNDSYVRHRDYNLRWWRNNVSLTLRTLRFRVRHLFAAKASNT